MGEPHGQNPGATRALAVLRFLATQPGPVQAARIAEVIGVPRSSMYHLLAAMQAEGFITHLPEDKRYGLGVAAVEIGSAYLRQEPLARLGRPLLARLVKRVGLPAHLGVLHGRETLYVVEQRPPRGANLVTDVDVRLPAHLTATGLAMLADLPPVQVSALFPDAAAFVNRTGDGPKSLPALRRLLAEVRTHGYAEEHGEVTAGFASVAVASHDRQDRPVAAVAITYPQTRVLDLAAITDAVRRTAHELTRRLGGTPS